MDSVDYKQKYLKYKNKYMELKAQEQKIQSGGHMYSSGEYVFFIPEKTSNFDANQAYVKNGTILSLDKLTNYLGNCTKFLRIGSTVNNKTIYTNQSSTDVLKRETKDIKDKSVAAYNVAKDESKKAWDASKPYVDKTLEVAKQGAKAVGNVATQAYNATKDVLIKKQDVKDEMTDTIHPSDLETTDEEKPKEQQVGGDNDCDKLPIPLPDNLKGFSFDNEVNEKSLIDYIELINKKQPNEKISRVIVVQKKTNSFGFGGETRLKYNFNVSYDNNEQIVVKK